MKYFQNVVETVRDLASPQATEKVYKEGMRKDQDGFMYMMYSGENTFGAERLPIPAECLADAGILVR